MKIFWAAGAVALAVGAYVFSEPAGGIDAMTVSSIGQAQAAGHFFRMQVDGRESDCIIGATADGLNRRPLSIGAACADMVPDLAGARWWTERADGSVAFLADDGRVAAEFAVADGAAFESYAPRQPIMTLLAR